MTPQAFNRRLALLEHELLSFEREAANANNETERLHSLHRADGVRRDIAHLKSGHFNVGK
jgi:ribosomal protein L29